MTKYSLIFQLFIFCLLSCGCSYNAKNTSSRSLDECRNCACQFDPAPVGSVPYTEIDPAGRVKQAGYVIYNKLGKSIRVGRWTEWSDDRSECKVGEYCLGMKYGDWIVCELINEAVYDPFAIETWVEGNLINTKTLVGVVK
jgi:hypothetical protein